MSDIANTTCAEVDHATLDSEPEQQRCATEGCNRPRTTRRKSGLCASCEYLRRNTIREAKPTRRPSKVKPPFGAPRASTMPEQIIDLDHAIAELVAARPELLAIPPGLMRHKRVQLALEPMSRLDLVVRFLEGIMRRNGWRRGEQR